MLTIAQIKTYLWHWKEALMGPVVGIAVLLWGQATGQPLPWGLFAACVLGGLALQFWSELKKEREAKRIGPVTTTDWKDLASKFQRIPHAYVRAEWHSETLNWDGNLVGERWAIRDMYDNQFASQCEALCRLGGAMLLKSPKVSSRLSEKVRTRTDDVYRWLYFVAEREGMAMKEMTGKVTVRTEKKEHWMKTIESLSMHSANGCLECAAKEI